MSNYYTIITKVGQAKIMQAIMADAKLSLDQFAIGDGAGGSYDPDESQTALKREVYRAEVTSIRIADAAINMIEISMSVPAHIGGWTVREMGVFDADGDLIAISKTPEDDKPAAGSGAAKDVIYRLFIVVTNTDIVEIKIDPNTKMATKEEVQAARDNMKAYTDQQLATHNAADDAHSAAFAAVNAATDTLAGLLGQMQHYQGFADVDPAYTSATAFATVFNTMAAGSILCAQVTANSADYPTSGLLEVIKLDDTHAACTLRAADGDYSLTITPENAEQIFWGGR